MPSGAVVLHVAGELDLATAPRLEDAIAGASHVEHVVIDLSGCTFLDSSGVRSLVLARRNTPPDQRVDLVSADPSILRVLEITGVDTMLAVHPSVEAAL
jgi:anti-sigma B factor antagonist